ncbi:MAG: hypothetical protein KDJ99_13900, partial [Candidatus Competibacteraceae bacterium]|nr:hypothetical protein [Candidatus Competibacteraceae bacterium]
LRSSRACQHACIETLFRLCFISSQGTIPTSKCGTSPLQTCMTEYLNIAKKRDSSACNACPEAEQAGLFSVVV